MYTQRCQTSICEHVATMLVHTKYSEMANLATTVFQTGTIQTQVFMSFPALTSNFRGKWNAAMVIATLLFAIASLCHCVDLMVFLTFRQTFGHRFCT